MYLCTRKSAYCAGPRANNTLIKSDLAFTNEAVEVSFSSGFCMLRRCERHLKRKKYIYNIINY